MRVFIKLFALVNAFGNQTKDVNDAQWPLMIISDLFDLFNIIASSFHLLVSKLFLNKVHCDIHGPGHLGVKKCMMQSHIAMGPLSTFGTLFCSWETTCMNFLNLSCNFWIRYVSTGEEPMSHGQEGHHGYLHALGLCGDMMKSLDYVVI